jgi:DNA-directed RNA polymerase subunit alpha
MGEAAASAAAAVIPDGGHITVDELDLPTRIYNSLKNAGIETVSDLLTTPRKELMTYRNLGAKSLSIIEEALGKKGIEFNA